jgi:hypothetical protein
MKSDRGGLGVSAVLMCVAVVLIGPGCAGQRVASTTGDQSVSTKEKGIGEESVREDQLASVQGTAPYADSPSQRGTRGGAQGEPSASESGSAQLGRDAGGQTEGSALSSRSGIGLGDIYFDFDQYAIRRDAMAAHGDGEVGDH